MDKGILKTAFKGLHKETVLTNVNAIEALFLAVQSGAMDKSAAIDEAEHILNAPIKTQFGGFAKEDVRAYFKKMYDAILAYEPENK